MSEKKTQSKILLPNIPIEKNVANKIAAIASLNGTNKTNFVRAILHNIAENTDLTDATNIQLTAPITWKI